MLFTHLLMVAPALVLSGIAALTYPQWIPVIQRWKNRDRVDQDINVDSGDRSLSKARILLSEACDRDCRCAAKYRC